MAPHTAGKLAGLGPQSWLQQLEVLATFFLLMSSAVEQSMGLMLPPLESKSSHIFDLGADLDLGGTYTADVFTSIIPLVD